jgi:hypothetical protein
MSETRTFDYDPMVYDTMRELATQLGGYYMSRAYAATSDVEHDRWSSIDLELQREIHAVDVYDEAAIRAKTAELGERLRAVRAA